MGTIEVIALALALAAAILFYLALRRWVLQRRGAVDLSLRTRPGSGGRGWVLGVARYSGDDLIWYRVFSPLPGPARTLSRAALEVVSRRTPDGAEAWSVQPGARVLECLHAGAPIQLAMGEETLTGFLSWLESAPPGYTMPGYLTG
jgi:Protein of unknown function (DUF2550)